MGTSSLKVTPPGRGPGPNLKVTFALCLKALRRFIQFCHFERQREIFSNQDSSSLSLLGMTTAKASKIILNIVEFLGSNPPGPRPGTEPRSNFYCMVEGTETIHPILSFRATARNL